MSFYKSIAKYYDQIFPLNYDQVGFVLEKVNDIEKANILDIGCGTGSFTVALSKMCNNIIGIDLDDEMLVLAEKKSFSENIRFEKCNMLSIKHSFDENTYDAITCFGNTLVHLNSNEEISTFVDQCKSILKTKGKLLLQIINYNRILDEGIDGLPTIENENVKFVRQYEYLPEYNEITFATELLHKKTCAIIENKQQLYPIRQQELLEILENKGFKIIKTYGSFKKDELQLSSIPFIVEAELNA